MFPRKILISAMIIAGTIGAITTALPVVAATVRVITVERAPPEPRNERVPAARRGYVWAPGYWNWNNNRHSWVKGSWVRERHGYAYNPHRWVESNGRWSLERSRWDRDGDGVPNNRDRAPDNPRRN